jgi:hypothetical protein
MTGQSAPAPASTKPGSSYSLRDFGLLAVCVLVIAFGYWLGIRWSDVVDFYRNILTWSPSTTGEATVGLLMIPALVVAGIFRLVFGKRLYLLALAVAGAMCWAAWIFVDSSNQYKPPSTQAKWKAVKRDLATSWTNRVRTIAGIQ